MENYSFKTISVEERLPNSSDNDGVVIAFVPTQGFQSCKYFNGSNTWQSMITRQTVQPTHWLSRFDPSTLVHIQLEQFVRFKKEFQEKECHDCGDRGWLYDDAGRRTGICPCHLN